MNQLEEKVVEPSVVAVEANALGQEPPKQEAQNNLSENINPNSGPDLTVVEDKASLQKAKNVVEQKPAEAANSGGNNLTESSDNQRDTNPKTIKKTIDEGDPSKIEQLL